MSKRKVKCDECKKEFLLKAVDIQEIAGKIKGNKLTLMFFSCPKCNKIYKICIKDEQYNVLVEDLKRAKERFRKSKGVGSIELLSELESMIQIKSKRLKNYTDKLNSKYPGTFTFASKNKKGIIYRENYTDELFGGE